MTASGVTSCGPLANSDYMGEPLVSFAGHLEDQRGPSSDYELALVWMRPSLMIKGDSIPTPDSILHVEPLYVRSEDLGNFTASIHSVPPSQVIQDGVAKAGILLLNRNRSVELTNKDIVGAVEDHFVMYVENIDSAKPYARDVTPGYNLVGPDAETNKFINCIDNICNADACGFSEQNLSSRAQCMQSCPSVGAACIQSCDSDSSCARCVAGTCGVIGNALPTVVKSDVELAVKVLDSAINCVTALDPVACIPPRSDRRDD